MKHLRKSFLALLALTLFGGAGAWAQGPTVTELTDVPDNWSGVYTTLTAADLPGFVAVDSATAEQWEYASTSSSAMLIYGFTTDGKVKYVYFDLGTKSRGTTYLVDRASVYGMHSNSTQFFYTTAPAEIELTKSGDNQWSLGQAPDYDLELQVEYYQKHALKNIPAGWTVEVNGIEQATPYQGDSLLITETDSVTLVPGNPRRVKSVTLEEEAPAVQTVNIDGVQLQIAEGDTYWSDIIARNPGVIWDDGGWIGSAKGTLGTEADPVFTSDTYDPSLNYKWQ